MGNWTQPVREECFLAHHYDGQQPARLKQAEEEVCCHCGARTKSGIYVRVDPATVAYPAKRDG